MAEQIKRSFVGPAIIFVFLALLIFNQWIANEFKESKKILKPLRPASLPAEQNVIPQKKSLGASTGEGSLSGQVIRRTIIERGSERIQHIFFIGDKEIARQIMATDGKMITQEGTIPNGLVKCFNDNLGTKGEEYYEDGRPTGTSRTYFANGGLRSELRYIGGKLMSSKEYYGNGKPFLEIDYRDAKINQKNKDDKEVGVGKLYYLDGTLKYEWNITNGSRCFKKSYNKDGTLRAETYFDENGQEIKDSQGTPAKPNGQGI